MNMEFFLFAISSFFQASLMIYIYVLDVNEWPPDFQETPYTANIPEVSNRICYPVNVVVFVVVVFVVVCFVFLRNYLTRQA